ncbi:MAG: heliorhodopsin HeR [Anaerolineales bacterium]|nr:MAG: heliorhodopsin HeR [Anaerolineales bacterium]
MDQTASERTFAGLRRFNLIMAFFHLAQSVFMIVVSNDTVYPIYTNFLKFDVGAMSVAPDPRLVYELPFGPAIAVFLLLSAIAHLYLSTVGYSWYVRNLRRGMNPARFYEYALSSSWMIVLIGMLVGMWDLGSLILMFGLNAMMNLLGIMMELHNQNTEAVNWTSFLFGTIAGLIPWIVIILHFFGSIRASDAEPPAFVYAIIPTIFVFFNIFAVNMLLQYKKVGRWRDYLFGERMFIVLSLLAKSALAWQIWFGTLRPT